MKKEPAKADGAYIKRLNKIKVLSLIRETGAISRAEVAKRTGLSAPTVTRVVDSLIHEDQLVMDIGAESTERGRPPSLIKFNGETNFVIGVDLGYTNIYAAIANLNGDLLSEIKIPTQMETGPEAVLGRTRHVISQILEYSDVSRSRIHGIGVAVAGLVNRDRNILEYSPDAHWSDMDIAGELGRETCLPIRFDNVTRVMAFGELWYGLGRKYRNFICLNVGHGIGGGIIIDGQPFYGTNGMTGEFGHTTVDPHSSRRCACGNYGCLEALASGNAIALTAREGLADGEKSLLWSLCDGDLSSISSEMVVRAAMDGDGFAKKVFAGAADYIGIALANMVNVFNPEAIALGGGVAQAGSLLLDPVRKAVSRRALDHLADGVVIVPATFGIKSAVKGSVAMILNEVLTLNMPFTPALAYLPAAKAGRRSHR